MRLLHGPWHGFEIIYQQRSAEYVSGDQRSDMVFHSVSGHLAEHKLAYLRRSSIKFDTPEQWMTNGSDSASVDVGIWDILKGRLQKRKIYTLCDMKQGLQNEIGTTSHK